MKKIFTLLSTALLAAGAFAQNYSAQNVTMLGHFNDPANPAESTYGIRYQGVWGWANPNDNREYAIIGGSGGYYFIDVTNPATPVQSDYVAGCHNLCIWHEIKTYSHYAYLSSDDGGTNCFQIVDLNYLPDSVHVVYQSNTLFSRAHTLYVDGNKLYAGSVTKVGNTYYSMAVYDLSNPELPVLMRHLDQDFATPPTVHDMFVRNDTVYASGGYDGLFIFKFNGSSTPFTQLATYTTYTEQGYNHSSFLTPNGHTLIFMDEVPAGLGVKSLDVSNLGNLTMNQVFRSTQGCTAHNPYIVGANTLVAAYYQDGIQIFNISNPSNVVRTGWFDTDTLNNQSNGYPQAYHGCWGAYTDLPSGNILASDMQNGLYILDISMATGLAAPKAEVSSLSAYPNPFNTNFSVNLGLDKAQNITYSVFDNSGRLVMEEQQNMPAGNSMLDVAADQLAPGVYSVHLKGETFSGMVKLVKTN